MCLHYTGLGVDIEGDARANKAQHCMQELKSIHAALEQRVRGARPDRTMSTCSEVIVLLSTVLS